MHTQPQPAVIYTPQPPPSPPWQSPPWLEPILSFVIMSKDKRFGGNDYYTAILTSQKTIFVPMTKEMVKQVTDINRQEAKGKLAPVQIYPYQQSYLTMPPEALITTDSLVIQNSSTQQITIRRVNIPGDGYGDFQENEVQFTSTMGTQVFKMSLREENVAKLMQAYSGRVVCR